MLLGLVLLTLGVGVIWLALCNWRHRHEEKISLVEAAILMATGAEPLPLTKLDRALQWFQLVMMSLLGPVMTLAGIAILIGEFQ